MNALHNTRHSAFVVWLSVGSLDNIQCYDSHSERKLCARSRFSYQRWVDIMITISSFLSSLKTGVEEWSARDAEVEQTMGRPLAVLTAATHRSDAPTLTHNVCSVYKEMRIYFSGKAHPKPSLSSTVFQYETKTFPLDSL